MQKLREGIRKFQQVGFESKRQLFEELAGGQHPLALFITCSDSRIDPSLLTQTDPGDLFVLRNAGNIVPPYNDAIQSGEAGTIEYAMLGLKIEHIIVCGHSKCGAMTALLHPEQTESLPAVRQWLKFAEGAEQAVRSKFSAIENQDELLDRAIEQNVLVQLENLRTHPTVAAALQRNELTLHGWVYQFETGRILSSLTQGERFVELGPTSSDNLPA